MCQFHFTYSNTVQIAINPTAVCEYFEYSSTMVAFNLIISSIKCKKCALMLLNLLNFLLNFFHENKIIIENYNIIN